MLAPGTQARASFQIAHVEPYDRRRIAYARAVVVSSRKLLQQPSPNLYLGKQRHDIVPLPDETEQHRIAEAQKYLRLAVECRLLACILVDQRDDYLRMADTYLAMAARSEADPSA